MDIIIKGASGFMGLFDTGAETFVSWVSGIVPKVLLLLILMNTIIALIGQERVNTVSYTHLRAHETDSYLVCRLLLEKKKKKNTKTHTQSK